LFILVIAGPVLIAIYGWSYYTEPSTQFVSLPADFLISWFFPAIAVILYWLYKQATPEDIAITSRHSDELTGNPISVGQAIGRYLAYFVAVLPLFLGIIWVALDPRKQGWHDKLAGTVVIRPQHRGPEPVRFER